MSLIEQIPNMVDEIKQNQDYLALNHKLFKIYEGQLLPFIENDLRSQLSPQSFTQVQHRIAPINVLKKIIDKLAKIYGDEVRRIVVNGTDSDSELLAWYERQMRVNQKMNISNEFFNLHKGTLLEPFVNNGLPSLRAIPFDRFWVFSNDAIDPTNPTCIVTFAGCEGYGQEQKIIFRAYTDEQFIIFDSDRKIRYQEMADLDNEEGVNKVGKIPFVYVNMSNNLLIPLQDTDTFRMSKLFPVLISDLNYAVMFQAFSIMYGIDLNDENLAMAPNAFWRLKSDPSSDKTPQIGSIKPQVDIDQVLGLIQAELSFWLNSKGIKPGAIGNLTTDNFASGISKMVDEMDTSDERKKQVGYFKDAENELWDLIFKYMHPVWINEGLIENNAQFSPNAKVDTMFGEQLPVLRRGDLIEDLKLELEAGFTSKKRAIKALNVGMTDDEIKELLAEIEEETMLTVSEGDEIGS